MEEYIKCFNKHFNDIEEREYCGDGIIYNDTLQLKNEIIILINKAIELEKNGIKIVDRLKNEIKEENEKRKKEDEEKIKKEEEKEKILYKKRYWFKHDDN